MKIVTKRELNQQTASVLAAVDAGEPVVVTEHGVPRWRIEAVVADEDPVDRLRWLGMLTSPVGEPEPWPARSVSPDPERVDRLLEEMRADRW